MMRYCLQPAASGGSFSKRPIPGLLTNRTTQVLRRTYRCDREVGKMKNYSGGAVCLRSHFNRGATFLLNILLCDGSRVVCPWSWKQQISLENHSLPIHYLPTYDYIRTCTLRYLPPLGVCTYLSTYERTLPTVSTVQSGTTDCIIFSCFFH